MRRHSLDYLVRRAGQGASSAPFSGLVGFKLRAELLRIIRDLSVNSPDKFEYRWPELKESLRAAGVVTAEDWQRCLLSCPYVPHLTKQVIEVTAATGDVWQMRNGDCMNAVALMLEHAQPSALMVQMDPDELRESCWMEMAQRWEGDLKVMLTSKEPADDILTPLCNSSCRLIEFWGPITSDDGIAAVASVAAADAMLHIWLEAPLQLCPLRGKYSQLKVHTVPFDALGGGTAAPLPAHPPPWLAVEFTQLGAWRNVVHTVQSLAPAGNRFDELQLRNSELSNIELDGLVMDLKRRGIRTAGRGPARWEKTWFGDYLLIITDET